VGFAGALVVAGFREAMHFFELLLMGQRDDFVKVATEMHPLRRLLTPVVGGCLAGLVLQYGMQLLRNHRSTTDYMEAFIVGDGHISVRASMIKSLSSLFSICSGGSMGREGAMVQLSAMVGSKLCRVMDFPTLERRTLVACGAAAGLASAYNAPLAATLFVSEIVVGSIAFEIVGPIIVSAVVANATMHDLLGYSPLFDIPDFGLASSWELLSYLFLGLLVGRMAPLYLTLLRRSSLAFARLPWPIFVRFLLGGLGLGVISVISPLVWGNGHSVVDSILTDPWTLKALLSVLVLKVLATAMTVGSGAVGGVFTPTLLVGAATGAIWGKQIHQFLPHLIGPAAAYAVVGMGAFLAATTRAPMMAIILLFEMTRDYDLVLPLMTACMAANYVALPYGTSMYAEALKRERAGDQADFSLLGRLVPGPVLTVREEDDLEILNQKFMLSPYNHVQVVDREGRWVGVLGRKAFLAAAPEATAGQLIHPGSRNLESTMSLQEALHAASEIPSELMPVVEPDSAKFLGTVAKSDLLTHLERSLNAISCEHAKPRS
jgi:H+/Cl- antiporter ClcA